MKWKITNVPNHQPAIVSGIISHYKPYNPYNPNKSSPSSDRITKGSEHRSFAAARPCCPYAPAMALQKKPRGGVKPGTCPGDVRGLKRGKMTINFMVTFNRIYIILMDYMYIN